jgi:hypothetical protein
MSGKNLRNLGEVVRDEMVMKEKILEFLEDGPKTLPQMAMHLNAPANEVIFWVMGLRRYGVIEEVGKPDSEGYFSYEAIDKKDGGHHD